MTFGDEKWAWVGGGEGKFSIYVMLTVVQIFNLGYIHY